MSIEAMKQALEALVKTLKIFADANERGVITDTLWFSEYETLFDYIESEITYLRQAIAEAEKQDHIRDATKMVEQEPVACQHKRYSIDVTEQIGTCIDCGSEGRMRFVVDDTHPQPKRGQGASMELDVLLDEAAVEMLNAFSSPSPHLNDYSRLRLILGEGHSGYGLYLSLAEYPEESSELLVNTHPQPNVTTSDMKQEYVAKTAKQRHEENT